VTRRFIIAAEGLSKDSEAELIAYFREHRMAWWHHIGNFWLATDRRDLATARAIRDKIKEVRGKPCLVMQIQDDVTWAGIRRAGRTDTFNWLSETWSGD
jgi:hypothetical protein